MDLRHMEYVVTLAQERHFTRAAQVLGLSQSGLSAAIRSLEEELRTPLFTRTTRRVEPTSAALALLPHASAMLDQARAARDAVVQATQQVSGTLRVGTEQCLGVIDVTALLERFHRRHPHVEIQFRQAGSHDLVEAVRADAMDVAFVAASGQGGVLGSQRLGQEDLVLLCPPGHPLTASANPTWQDLALAVHVDFDPTWGVRPLTEEAFASRGLHRNVRFQVSDVHTLIDFVNRGLGVAIVPAHVAHKPDASGLVTLPVPADAPRWEVFLVQSRKAASSPAPYLAELVVDAPSCKGSA